MPGHCQKVLIVTTERSASAQEVPALNEEQDGQTVVTDMVGAGYPFDVVTYSRFVSMSLANYDVIFLNGYSKNTSLADISGKCQSAIHDGRKVFINGSLPYSRYGASGNLLERTYYCNTLFGCTYPTQVSATGAVSVPSCIEKNPDITKAGMYGHVNYFTFTAPPSLTVVATNRTIGFVCPQGGAIDSTADYELALLDYGKVVTYLRYGGLRAGIGFANDRMEGAPLASFEVHCDETTSPTAISALDSLSRDTQIPLYNLLIYRKLNPVVASYWNALSNPMMFIGSHSWTHPDDWPSVPDLAHETTGAIAAQKLMVPQTTGYLDFSGAMNPTTAQIDQLYASGLVFGAAGYTQRSYSPGMATQLMPTNRTWFINLSNSSASPYCFGQTLAPDNGVYNTGGDYMQGVKTNFDSNVRYGLYTYGFFHDIYFTSGDYRTHGVQMSDQISGALRYLKAQGARFINIRDLILRLRDYVTGSISRVQNPDGTETLTVLRSNGCANEIKIGFRGDLTPAASGSSVLSQRLIGEYLYVTLRPETVSTVTASWSPDPPAPPVFVSPEVYLTPNSVMSWMEKFHPGGIAEYQYAIGAAPGGSDAVDWTSTGPATTSVIKGFNLPSGHTFYVSVKARYGVSGWSAPGVSLPLIADSTPPTTPLVLDDGSVQLDPSYIHATWTSNDPEAGIEQYQYAIGTTPGGTDTLDWTATTDTSILVESPRITPGRKHYVSVKALSRSGLWSSAGVSDGIIIKPTLGCIKGYRNGDPLIVDDVIVTRKFTGEFYVENQDRSAGMKVVTSEAVEEGQKLIISGTLTAGDTECSITNPTITHDGTGEVKPICLPTKSLGGSDHWLAHGATEGYGTNTIGLLVTVIGKITSVRGSNIYVDDGAGTMDGPSATGVLVTVADPGRFAEGQFVRVTGISSLCFSDNTYFQRSVRIQHDTDVVKLVP